ncbi:uncharacterized protein LOC131595547 [Vicia villosa]|uniref:uncharacterized protein LOC131595547 n=1 Tax=Vicia villosa TaxID=3911 RepID=UPI00273C210D|nr:uncharacterized protein LOC131595547 [Vicia villosa]
MDSSLINPRNLSRKTRGKRKIEESNVGDKKEDGRGYFTWNLDMERVLAETLRHQRGLGRQNGVRETVAYNVPADILSTRFNVQLNEEDVKNHIKLWRRWYRIVSDILCQSGFDWDDTKCMITVEDENAWNEYVKSHEEAKRFRFMVILNWNDIVDICAEDRASGVQVEHAFDEDDVMSNEASVDEKGSTLYIDSEEPNSATKKKIQCTCANKDKDIEGMINSMRELAESLKDFVQVSRKKMEGIAQEVVQEVLNETKIIFNSDDTLRYKAINQLIDSPKKLTVLKALPLSEKKNYLLASMY